MTFNGGVASLRLCRRSDVGIDDGQLRCTLQKPFWRIPETRRCISERRLNTKACGSAEPSRAPHCGPDPGGHQQSPPSDPVFNILEKTGHDGSDSDVDLRFRQCSQYLDLTERLQEARGRLQLQREGLQVAGERLHSDVAEVRGQTL
ncbi:hypothetical protein F7725_028322 [Dissostichus mawsoni]|uniref:Uncharacterized protein n=1 Tax=Dissostichus mawsoni TaxID=36200 RepID=A0A7J5XFH4_DISMA|nr:hypothetical protein F7725_028322 [Dissostichus mawsoni]